MSSRRLSVPQPSSSNTNSPRHVTETHHPNPALLADLDYLMSPRDQTIATPLTALTSPPFPDVDLEDGDVMDRPEFPLVVS